MIIKIIPNTPSAAAIMVNAKEVFMVLVVLFRLKIGIYKSFKV